MANNLLHSQRGSTVVEMVLCFGFFSGMLLIVLWFLVGLVRLQLMQYVAYRNVRAAELYEKPISEVQKNLEDKKREDNPIAYCGEKGKYRLCLP